MLIPKLKVRGLQGIKTCFRDSFVKFRARRVLSLL
jgi:hypothetical protein